MKTFELNGFVGGITKRPTTIFCAQNSDGSTWYVCDGGTVVNKTYEEVNEGTWIDELSDDDCFTWNEPITTLEEFETALED